ncbi:hypothetical protein [Streptomyces sp. NBC_00859]|uniref:hypothetical protein n=1 Tax=Streptomyces sp. NBC_00859 TaxID=2903682 RepID=UPI00386FE42A|nr:hypothetical protein OG584_00310 [Streptomyces sp. NBC_00859]WSZ86737.1 hypothetical protein OG584_34830 [Streptomyces sp. NBC_00859]
MIATTADRTVTTDPLTHAYQQAVNTPGSQLAHAMQRAEQAPELKDWAGQFLSRPVFADRRQLRTFADDVHHMLRLLTSLPHRLFDGDLDRYCAAAGIEGPRAELARHCGGGAPPLYGRADMYHDGTSFRLLEFGLASAVGGVDRAGEIPRALLGDPEFAAFADHHGLQHTDTGAQLATALRTAGAAVAPGRDPVIALVEGPGGLARYGTAWRPLRSMLRRHGLECHIGELDGLRLQGNRLALAGTPVDVIFRCFNTEQVLAEPDGLDLIAPVLHAHREGLAALWIPMESELFAGKRGMALLSDPRHTQAFSTEDRAVVERTLPWTRRLGAPEDLRDSTLMDYCRHEREHLVVKPDAEFGGRGVVAGWDTAVDDWRRVLHEGAEAGCVVQRRVVPRPEPVTDPATGQEHLWQTAWGLFYTPAGHAGTYARALPSGLSPVIGITAHPATRTAGVFHGDTQ